MRLIDAEKRMRLIDANKLCEDLLTRWELADKNKEDVIRQVMANIVTPIVVGQPTADAVSVVRCKDCRFYNAKGYCERKNVVANETLYYFDPIITDADDFCSKAERRSE